ncbi:MAG: hypothetical protein H6901_09905 [Rhodobacteraceae bacterium]|nr:hypothetical protein [Paracoccaceae bacterium]MCP5342516.1 hypothetical protein [Paracoccaceae bacterium]
MDSDLILVSGFLIVILSFLAMISAFAAERSMLRAIIFAAVGGAMIVAAVVSSPEGYRPGEIPDVFLRVLARLIR